MSALLSAVGAFASEGAKVRPETEIWNDGIELYSKGDVTNALTHFRSLILSKRYGARAAEVVAKIEYERGQREEALEAAAIALRSRPRDERTNRNFTRAVDGIESIRREKRINDAIEKSKGSQADQLMKGAQTQSRHLLDEAATFLDKPAAEAIRLGDELSLAAEKLSLVWPPVRAQLVQAVTNEEQAAAILTRVDEAEKATLEAARLFSDLDKKSYSAIAAVEDETSGFLKLLALPPLAIDEDLICQSNAFMNVKKINDRDWQREALDYTRAFRSKFPAWARAYEQQAQADTNKPPFTAEDQAAISDLAHRLEKIQLETLDSPLPPEMQKALDIIEKIRQLMPKDGKSGQNQQNPQNNDKPQNDKKDNQDTPQNGQNEQQPNEQEKQQENEEKSPEKDQVRPEVESILKKAQERTDEHEEEKKSRMRKQKLPPNERDW